MYANYFIVDNDFLNCVAESKRSKVADVAYSLYNQCCKKRSRRLSKDRFFASTKTRYPILFFYCPKCQASLLTPSLGFKQAQGLKYCPHCGEPSIDHRFSEGIMKISNLLHLSAEIAKTDPQQSKELNQCIITSLCSVYEVFLREFYADILNAKYVRRGCSLYHKFLKDCKNDFLNPGKTTDRLKKEIGINYKMVIGADTYKALSLLADYRNVIVHNNGICDATFICQHPEVEKHSQIKPSLASVATFIQTVLDTVNELNKVYEQELRNVAASIITEVVDVERLSTE